MHVFICVFLLCFFVSFLILVCVLHADGNITSKLIEQYSAAGCYNIVSYFPYAASDLSQLWRAFL
jgi:hypothetical protein